MMNALIILLTSIRLVGELRIVKPHSVLYYWAGWVIIAIQERMVQNQVLHSGAKVDSLIGSANCVHMYPRSGLSYR